jgi:hypothetical protein
MTNMELNHYIRTECRNDGSWLAELDKDKGRRTRVGVVDLILFVLGQRHARHTACC